MRDEIKMTDDELVTVFEKLGYGVCIEDVVLTRDTFEDFKSAAKEYNEVGRVSERGNVLTMDGVQVKKGETRVTVVVVDFGGVRAAIK